MHILFCNFEYPPLGGGGGVATGLFAEELAKRHDVTVLTSGALGLPADSVENGVRVVRVPVPLRASKSVGSLPSLLSYIPMAIREGRRLIRQRCFDVINTHFVLPTGPVGDALARYAGIPNVLSVHGGDLYDPSKWLSPHHHLILRVWIRALLKRADCVVGQSSNTICNIATYYTDQVEAERIPLGIKRPPVQSANRADFGLAEDEVLLITVGRLVARKEIHQLVQMMDSLRDRRARLLVVGSGPQEPQLREMVNSRGLEKHVRFMGHVSEADKFRLLHVSDLYVSSSQHEGFGIVFLEAMACGLPVVCYDHGGQTDFLDDGKTGFLLPLNDLAGLTRGCTELIENEILSKRIYQYNLQRIEDFFIERTTLGYERVFQSVIGTHAEASLGHPHRT